MTPPLHVNWADLASFEDCPCVDLVDHVRGACGRVTNQHASERTSERVHFEHVAWRTWRIRYNCERRIDRLETEIEDLKEALRFYAGSESDGGSKARSTLDASERIHSSRKIRPS